MKPSEEKFSILCILNRVCVLKPRQRLWLPSGQVVVVMGLRPAQIRTDRQADDGKEGGKGDHHDHQRKGVGLSLLRVRATAGATIYQWLIGCTGGHGERDGFCGGDD